MRRPATQEELAQGALEMRASEERLRREGIEVVDPRRNRLRSPEDERESLQEFLISPTATPQILGPSAPQGAMVSPGSEVTGEGDGAEDGGEKVRRQEAREEEQRMVEQEGSGGRDLEGSLSVVPLFSDQQILQMEQMYARAPLLQRSEPTVERPQWMRFEDERYQKMQEEREREREELTKAAMMREFQPGQLLTRIHGLERQNEQTRRANEEIRSANEELRKERDALLKESQNLKERMKLFEASPYGTPEESRRVVPLVNQEVEKEDQWEDEKRAKVVGEGFGDGWRREGRRFEEPEAFRTPGEEEYGSKRAESSQPDQSLMMKGMLKLMEGMQALQTEIMSVKKSKDVEVVKGFVGELQKLPEWRADSAPLDLMDWLLSIGPMMGDLSDNSQTWWEQVLEMVKVWYHDHLELSPLESGPQTCATTGTM